MICAMGKGVKSELEWTMVDVMGLAICREAVLHVDFDSVCK